jgi:ligand-binding SRPBCC domain-containing protein
MPHQSEFAEWVPFPPGRVFLFFANPENLPRIMPPASDTRIENLKLIPPPPLPDSILLTRSHRLAGIGSEIVTSFRVAPPLPFRGRWIARITEFEWNHHFADIQVQGPFQSWLHRHELAGETRTDVDGTLVRDWIEYEIGFGFLGVIAQRVFVDRQMKATFAHRQGVLEGLLRGPTAASRPIK